jgi:hypothetical protein
MLVPTPGPGGHFLGYEQRGCPISPTRSSPVRRHPTGSWLNGNEFIEPFSASPEALRVLAEFSEGEAAWPPWDHAAELLADGLIDTNFALTPRGRRALAAQAAAQ